MEMSVLSINATPGRLRAIAALAALLCASTASAQMYKWVDEKGVVQYSDRPPATQTKVELKSYSGGDANVELPFALAAAIKNNPVTIYTTSQCEPCAQALSMLRARGVPYTEKTVLTAEDHAVLKRVGGKELLPLITIGRNKLSGFEANGWNAALTAATYPEQSVLPVAFRYAQAESAAAPRPSAPDATAQAAAKAAEAAEATRRARAAEAIKVPEFQF